MTSEPSYNTKVHMDQGGGALVVESGGVIDVLAGGKLQNNGVDMDLSAGIATATSSTTGELDTLHSVVPGAASASKALVLSAGKGATGVGPFGARRVVVDLVAGGAAAIAPSVVTLGSGGAITVTLADPAAGDEGTEMLFIAKTAQAHIVSNAAGSGFNGAGAGADVATFGGAIGDNLRVVALGGKWLVISKVNATLA